MNPILKVDDINVYYGSIHAIKGVSFEVNEGDEDFIPFFKFMANFVCPDHFSFDISDITINTDKVFIWPEEEFMPCEKFLKNFKEEE